VIEKREARVVSSTPTTKERRRNMRLIQIIALRMATWIEKLSTSSLFWYGGFAGKDLFSAGRKSAPVNQYVLAAQCM
jgi:hypothetical protein